MDTDLRSLDWSRVQAFVAVAQTGSLSAAARMLNVSQPTLGRQIKAMEGELGVTLFHRQPRGLILTDTGAALLAPAEAMAEAAKQMELAAAGRKEDIAGTVRISASVSVATICLPQIIASIRKAEPSIQIEVASTDGTDNLLFREADIALRMFRPTQLDVIARHVADMTLGACATQRYIDAHPPPQSIEDMVSMDLVGYDKEEWIIRGMRDFGINVTRSDFATRCDDQNVVWALIAAGCGIGAAPMKRIRETPGMVQLGKGLPIPSLPIWLTAHEVMRRTPRIRRVWDILADELPRVLDPPAAAQ